MRQLDDYFNAIHVILITANLKADIFGGLRNTESMTINVIILKRTKNCLALTDFSNLVLIFPTFLMFK